MLGLPHNLGGGLGNVFQVNVGYLVRTACARRQRRAEQQEGRKNKGSDGWKSHGREQETIIAVKNCRCGALQSRFPFDVSHPISFCCRQPLLRGVELGASERATQRRFEGRFGYSYNEASNEIFLDCVAGSIVRAQRTEPSAATQRAASHQESHVGATDLIPGSERLTGQHHQL